MRLTAFLKLYKICILLHRCNLKILAKNRFEKSAISVKIQQKTFNILQMSQNLQNFAKFQKCQLDNLVDFEKCCKAHMFLQKSVPIQPKTSNILPKFCQKLATTLRVRRGPTRSRRRQPAALDAAGSTPRACPVFGKSSAKCCSFSAVSAPIFASRYAFCSIFQNLPDSQAKIFEICLLYTSPSPRDGLLSRMPSSA